MTDDKKARLLALLLVAPPELLLDLVVALADLNVQMKTDAALRECCPSDPMVIVDKVFNKLVDRVMHELAMHLTQKPEATPTHAQQVEATAQLEALLSRLKTANG